MKVGGEVKEVGKCKPRMKDGGGGGGARVWPML